MSGSLRVRVASAGTGKTTVLVARYLELIGLGVPLRRIAGATFTRAAAGELRERVAAGIRSLLDEGTFLDLITLEPGLEARYLEAERELPGALLSTISGLMIRFLRLTAPQAGLDPDFRVLDETEAALIFEEELGSLTFTGDRSFDDAERERVLELFAGRSLSREFTAASSEAEPLLGLYAAASTRYRQRLGPKLLGPADVELRALRLTERPPLLRRIRSRFSHVLLDEYQDVNPVQGSFFRALVAAGLNVEAVGDPKQSIYAFRDADVEVFRTALREGERLPDLRETRRHTPEVAAFLNHLTAGTAGPDAGFSASEAPPVRSAGLQAQRSGSVTLHWLDGRAGVGVLRNQEARLLATLLAERQRDGFAWEDMAVIARTHGSLETARRALSEAGIPSSFGSGRGFYSRPEIIDVANALASGISADGPEFAAWLRSPFVQLDQAQTQEVLLAADRHEALRSIDPGHLEALRRLSETAKLPPVAALKAVLREPLACGRPYPAWLGSRQRANLDALLQRTAAKPPADLELLLHDLRRQRRSRTAEVPEAGAGVALVTVHFAKGLEWPVAAVFDAGRHHYARDPLLLVRRTDGSVALPGTETYLDLLENEKVRREQENIRQFYVAASRPRDHLIITGSKNGGYAPLLKQLGLLPEGEGPLPAGTTVFAHSLEPAAAAVLPDPRAEAPVRPRAPWTARGFPAGVFPAVASPSKLQPAPEEPAGGQGDLRESGVAVSFAAAAGTLLHSAIAWDWEPSDERFRENLLAQEVMFPFTTEERDGIVQRVSRFLAAYRRMLGRELPALSERERDEAELPVIVPYAGTVWQGTADRLYRVDGAWYLDDYKTDAEMNPGLYTGQLAMYALALSQALGSKPAVRLVWLRHGHVTRVPWADLEAALAELLRTAAA